MLCALSTFSNAQGCKEDALKILKSHYPRGLAILDSLKPENRKAWVEFIDCTDYQNTIMSLSTVVHEAVHELNISRYRRNRYSFLLPNDTVIAIALPENVMESIYPWKINVIFNTLSEPERKVSRYAETYLQGTMGEQGFFTLLEELSAYLNGLDAAIHLPRLTGGYSHSELAGPLAMTTFILRYYQYFEKKDANYFQQVLMRQDLRLAVKRLIIHALNKVKEGRHLEDLQTDIEEWEQIIQAKEHQRMLKQILEI